MQTNHNASHSLSTPDESASGDDLWLSSDRHTQIMTDAMPNLAWTATPTGERDYYNRRWFEYTGWEPGELANNTWIKLIHPDDHDRVIAEWNDSITTGSDYQVEYRLRSGDGTYHWFIGRGVPYRNSSGKIIKWFGTSTNIDDRKHEAEYLEELVANRTVQLQTLNAALRSSNQDLQDFAYIASHDLQEPLRKIQAFGNLLEEESKEQLGDDGLDYLRRMKAAADRMSTLIEDLLMFSRVSTMERRIRPTDLNDTIDQVMSDLETRIDETGGKIVVGELPEVMADPTHMRQLFQNLIGNALKFHRDDTTPVVRINATLLPHGTCSVTIVDNGIGFDEKYTEKIFAVFHRLHGRTEYEGTGIGLAVCRKIVERYGGTIEAQSINHKGATFTVILPIKEVDA